MTPSTTSGSTISSQDEHGIYDCTHCFNCIDACPKGVDPMSQIMRLRRRAGSDYKIVDRNNGHRHEAAFVTLVRDYGLLNEAELLPRSYGGNSWFGKFHPAAGKELLSSISTVITGVMRGKMSPKIALFGHKLKKQDLGELKQIYDEVEGREQRDELNLYVTGYEDEPEAPQKTEPPKPSVPAGEPEAPVSPPSPAPDTPDKSPTFPGPGEGSETAPSESESS